VRTVRATLEALFRKGAVARRERQRPANARSRGVSDLVGEHSGWIFALLRLLHPIVSTRRVAVVTRADDVREVLSDHEHFTVAHYAPRMLEITGPFILGLDDNALYRHDHVALRAALRPEDVPLIGEQVLAAARARVAAASADRELDIVTDLVDPVIDQVVAEYLGAPGPDPSTQLRWARDIFEHIFLNASNSPAVRNRALADAVPMRAHLDGLIATRKAALLAGRNASDDVLTRLLRAQQQHGLHDLAIRHNLLGLITGWIPTASKAFVMVVEELLRRPAQLGSAQRAARAGDRALLAAHVFEALRFRPQTWALLRVCSVEQKVATGTCREAAVPAGARVLLGTRSAMFDRRVVRAPGKFRLDRPWGEYLHFGYGLHTCFGEEINRAQLPALAMALLEGDDIARAGKLCWQGPYPSGLRVRQVAGR
jgi:cytochrome P450